MINILLSTARSGSTWYGAVLSRKYRAILLNEIFHNESTDHHKKTFYDVMKTFSNTSKNCVIKIFPNHFFKTNIPELESVLLSTAKNIEILVRRDFNSQLMSLYTAYEYENSMNPEGLTLLHTWQNDFIEPFVIKKINHSRLETVAQHLQEELIFLSKIYQTYNVKLTYFEDVKDDYTDLNLRVGKLNRPVVWEESFPNISFDTESLFK